MLVFLVDYGADRLDYGEWNFQNVSFKKRLEAFGVRLSFDLLSLPRKKVAFHVMITAFLLKEVFEASKFCSYTTSQNCSTTLSCLSVFKCLNTWSNYHLVQAKTALRQT